MRSHGTLFAKALTVWSERQDALAGSRRPRTAPASAARSPVAGWLIDWIRFLGRNTASGSRPGEGGAVTRASWTARICDAVDLTDLPQRLSAWLPSRFAPAPPAPNGT